MATDEARGIRLMGWPASIGVGILTAATAAVMAGWVAALSVDWYRISSFEGKSGYFIVGMALLGLMAGLLIGIVAARIVSAGPAPGFLKALGVAQGIALGLIALIGGAARLLADVPPRLGGQELLLAVEFRWPEGQDPGQAADSSLWSLRLGSSAGRVMRASTLGPLWREDARLEDGRWVVPGAVELFTGRGKRTVDVLPEGIIPGGYLVPLPSRPGKEHLDWSEWLPRARPGEPPLQDGFRYRFRVVPRDQPIRAERFGPFEVLTVASGFGKTSATEGPPAWYASARFRVRHLGQPVRFEERNGETGGTEHVELVDQVAALAGPRPALLVQVDSREEEASCHLVVAGDGTPAITVLSPCGSPRHATPLAGSARGGSGPEGIFDRVTFAEPGLYHLRGQVLDTRTLVARAYSAEAQHRLIERIPPLGVSPDGNSFVRLEWGEDSDDPLNLAVTRIDTGERYRLPIDPARMRYMDIDQIDPAWVAHHFAWTRTPGGADRLVERAGFAPLAWHGSLTGDDSYREYRVGPASAGLRPALIEFLVTEFQAERQPADESAFSHEVRIGGVAVHVSFREEDGHVGVWMDRGTDTRLVATIASRFDEALKTRRYDALFAK